MKRLSVVAAVAALVLPSTALAVPSTAVDVLGQEFHDGWFAIGEIAQSPSRQAWHRVEFCCKNKNKNTTYALVRGLDGQWYCGGASIAVEGGCTYQQEQQATYGYLRNTGSEGYSLSGWVWDFT